ncbi:MAG: MBL fold metallo-hydrolase [Clostridia bacterium]|nr:MBL fold metallo-hydrolase [Clostridia bacterium]
MKKFNGIVAVFLAVVLIALGAFGGYVGYHELNELKGEVYADPNGEMQVHFLELGNWYTGDCTYIKAGETDILIDAGSNTDSIKTIKSYIDQYVTDGKLEYVIVTHAHKDHYAGFATNENTDSLFDLYECEIIIDFAQTNQEADANMYSNYVRERDAEIAAGATHYTAKECIDQDKRVFAVSSGVTMTVLDQKYYHEKDKSGENNHSVCTLFTCGEERVLLTGDLEKEGEKSLIEKNELSEVTLYKAGHHGSKTSSSTELMSIVKPEIICVCCCAGSDEYRATAENTFPTQEFIDNVAPYTDEVYVTSISTDNETRAFASMNGNITVSINRNGFTVKCSESDIKLKDTDWFKSSRTCPDAWK